MSKCNGNHTYSRSLNLGGRIRRKCIFCEHLEGDEETKVTIEDLMGDETIISSEPIKSIKPIKSDIDGWGSF